MKVPHKAQQLRVRRRRSDQSNRENLKTNKLMLAMCKMKLHLTTFRSNELDIKQAWPQPQLHMKLPICALRSLAALDFYANGAKL